MKNIFKIFNTEISITQEDFLSTLKECNQSVWNDEIDDIEDGLYEAVVNIFKIHNINTYDDLAEKLETHIQKYNICVTDMWATTECCDEVIVEETVYVDGGYLLTALNCCEGELFDKLEKKIGDMIDDIGKLKITNTVH